MPSKTKESNIDYIGIINDFYEQKKKKDLEKYRGYESEIAEKYEEKKIIAIKAVDNAWDIYATYLSKEIKKWSTDNLEFVQADLRSLDEVKLLKLISYEHEMEHEKDLEQILKKVTSELDNRFKLLMKIRVPGYLGDEQEGPKGKNFKYVDENGILKQKFVPEILNALEYAKSLNMLGEYVEYPAGSNKKVTVIDLQALLQKGG